MFGFLTNPEVQVVAQLISAGAALACIVWVGAFLGFGWLLMGRMGRDTLPTVAMAVGALAALLSLGPFVELLVAILRLLPPSWHKTGLVVMQFGSIALLLAVFAFAATRETALTDALRRRKGVAGERLVSARLKALGYEHLDNRYVGDASDVAQVDHIACVGGLVLVIETKHLEGRIYPQGDGALTQWFDDEKNPTTVPSPVRQNERQVAAVAKLAQGIGVKGVVVFTDRAEFPKGLPTGCVRLKDLGAYLRYIASSTPASATTTEAWATLRTQLESLDQVDLRGRHIEMLTDNAAFRSLPEGVAVCRKCQGVNVKAEFGYSYHWRCADCGGRSAMKAHEAEALGIPPDKVGASPKAASSPSVHYEEESHAFRPIAPVVPRAPVDKRLPISPKPRA